MMTAVYLSLGSNIQPAEHIVQGLKMLSDQFGELTRSTVYQCPAVGFDGDDFYNLVVKLDTNIDVLQVMETLREIEMACGRTRAGQKFSARTLDIDLLLYGDLVCQTDTFTLPRDEITRYGFVLRPLAELIPNDLHVPSGLTYATLWADFDDTEQPMWAIEWPPLMDVDSGCNTL